MTAKEYLRQVNIMRAVLRSMELHIQELYHMADGLKAIRYDLDKVQTSADDRMSGIISEMLKDEEKYARLAKRYNTAVIERAKLIGRMDNPQQAEVLMLRYIDGKSWTEISDIMHYSTRHITRLHGRALLAFTRRYQHILNRK